MQSRNPRDDSVVGELEAATAEDVATAVAAARVAQPMWEAMSRVERADALAAGISHLAARGEEVAALASAEMGKPEKEALGELNSCTRDVRGLLDEISLAVEPEVLKSAGVSSTLYRDPLGVVGAITPWNFPISMPHWLIVPALAVGNTVVFKPSEETPLTGAAYAECLMSALPPGVLQVVHGQEATGKALVGADIDMIAFTGSREAGKHILASAAAQLKRVILELGGKDPLIVLEGADLEKAAAFAARNSFRNAGQVCVSTERIFVDQGVHDAFVNALKSAAARIEIGPMVNARQKAHVVKQVAAAEAAGAKRVFGPVPAQKGNRVEPIVLTDVDDAMDIAREETFGPIACVTKVSGADDAVARANDTPFGLGAVVFGPAGEVTRSVARRLKAGMIGVNRSIGGASGAPWVGARESGYGFHSGVEGHRQFTQLRMVSEADVV